MAMTRDRSSDTLVAAAVGSSRLEGLDVPDGDIALAEAYTAGEMDGEAYLAEVQRRIAEDVPVTRA